MALKRLAGLMLVRNHHRRHDGLIDTLMNRAHKSFDLQTHTKIPYFSIAIVIWLSTNAISCGPSTSRGIICCFIVHHSIVASPLAFLKLERSSISALLAPDRDFLILIPFILVFIHQILLRLGLLGTLNAANHGLVEEEVLVEVAAGEHLVLLGLCWVGEGGKGRTCEQPVCGHWTAS